jgi:tetratricopeptide (TPR) repeat protein/F0F1-type ATP synthase membrane subunit c/vacuolar-type H+-ATPase subunit K
LKDIERKMETTNTKPAPGANNLPDLAVVLVILTLITYAPALRCGFIWDDDDHFTRNPAMNSVHGLTQIWSSLAVSRYYPLTLTTFWVERRLWVLHPLLYHAVNIALQAANAVLLWTLLRRLRVPGAWVAAALWAVHPVCVESVAWVTELKNIQSGFFFFLSVLCFLRFETDNKRESYALACAFGAAAMLSKPSTVVLPLVLLLCAWWERGRWRRVDILRVAPFFGLALGISAMTVVEQHRWVQQAGAADWGLAPAERLVIAGKTVWFYAAHVLWPAKLMFVYPRWNVSVGSASSWLPFAGAIAVGAFLWTCRRQPWARAGLFGTGFFVVALLPVMGFFNMYFFRYTFVADHFQYLASIGIITLAVAVPTRLVRERVPRVVLGVGVVVVLVVLSWQHCAAFQNEGTLWRDTLAKNPDCWMAHDNLAKILILQGNLAEARDHCEQALRINPDDPDGHNDLGIALQGLGNVPEAVKHFERALQISADYAQAHNNLGLALVQLGKVPEAIQHYEQALQIFPDFAEARYDLGNALLQQGKLTEAIKQYEQAVRIWPDYANAHYNLGLALWRVSQPLAAISHYQEALRINPGFKEAHVNLGIALLRFGNTRDALPHFIEAVRLQPSDPNAHYNLGKALAQAGSTTEAIEQYQQALTLKPDFAAASKALAEIRGAK